MLSWKVALHPRKLFYSASSIKLFLPCGILSTACNLLYNPCKVGAGASKNDVRGTDTLKFTRPIGSDTLSTDTCRNAEAFW